MKKASVLVIMLLISIKSFCQFTRNDISVSVSGLDEKYSSRFKDENNIADFINILNEFEVPSYIGPIKIDITFENGVGNVLAEINYNHDKIFSDYPYNASNMQGSRWGTGISVFLQHQIFSALSKYKKSVATEGYMMDKDLLDFESGIKCIKENGDFIFFYAYNNLNSHGFYPYTFYRNAHLSISGKIHEVESANTNTLNGIKFFLVGKTIGLDGSKTGAFYFCEFFKIKND